MPAPKTKPAGKTEPAPKTKPAAKTKPDASAKPSGTAKPVTPEAYLASLPPDRRAAVEQIRRVVRESLDPRVVEGIGYGMLAYSIPHSVYPPGYHCDPRLPLGMVMIGSPKSHIALHLFCLYCDEDESARFAEAWRATGKRLDMGKACVRVKRAEDVPLDVLAQTLRRMTPERFIAVYESMLTASCVKHPGKTATTPGSKARPAAAGGGKAVTAKASEKGSGKTRGTPSAKSAAKKSAAKKTAGAARGVSAPGGRRASGDR
jgi:hypothetical protein